MLVALALFRALTKTFPVPTPLTPLVAPPSSFLVSHESHDYWIRASCRTSRKLQPLVSKVDGQVHVVETEKTLTTFLSLSYISKTFIVLCFQPLSPGVYSQFTRFDARPGSKGPIQLSGFMKMLNTPGSKGPPLAKQTSVIADSQGGSDLGALGVFSMR